MKSTTSDTPTVTSDRNQLIAVLVGSIALTIAVFYVPILNLIGRPLLLFSTFAHEMGHGIAAEITGGDFIRFVMHADGSGAASTMTPTSAFARAFVSLGGLIGPAMLASILFVVTSKPRAAKWALMALGAACLLSVALVVRNTFGVAFVSAFGAVFLAIGYFAPLRVSHFTMVFVAVQLALSVFSRGDYLFTRDAQTATGVHPSDVSQIQNALFLPYWFWGALIAVLSVVILAVGIRFYLKAVTDPGKPAS